MQDLIRILTDHGAALVGFADLTVLSSEARQGLPRGVSIAVALGPVIVAGIAAGPTAAYHAEYNRANALLDDLARRGAAYLIERGYAALPLAATDVGIDPATHSTRLPHKTVATLAGLGWIGKCALLITEEYGSAIRIASVLTDAPLPVAEPVRESRCGDCTACVAVCPGAAPSGQHWQPGVPRDGFFDAFACRRAARELAGRAGIDESICGMCIAACPWTQEYLRAG
jgi:epoxyqueuosine reductase